MFLDETYDETKESQRGIIEQHISFRLLLQYLFGSASLLLGNTVFGPNRSEKRPLTLPEATYRVHL